MRWIAGTLGLTMSVAIPAAGQPYLDEYTSSFLAAMTGQSQVALRAARQAAESVGSRRVPQREALTVAVYTTMVTFGRWDALLDEPLPPGELRFATAMAYYARGVAFAAKGRWAEAGASFDTVAAAARTFSDRAEKATLEIATHALAGEIALRRGESDAAVAHFTTAVRLEDRLTDHHPPTWYYPVRQSLGKALLAADRPAEAERVYREDLSRFPDNGWSLFGLMKALERQGRTDEAAATLERYEAAWRSADVRLEASRF